MPKRLTAAFGRMSTFAENDLIQNEEWYIHPLACEYDKDTCALVKLRRNFVSFFHTFPMGIDNDIYILII